MPIRLSQFGGVVPKLNPEKLPDNAAQDAQNCDLTAGVLAPISVATPFSTMVDDDGTLKAGVPSADLVKVTKPSAPSYNYTTHYCQPYWWCRLNVRVYAAYMDPADRGGTGEYQVVTLNEQLSLKPQNIEHDESGVWMTFLVQPFQYEFDVGTEYFIYGPNFQFDLCSSITLGGPDSATLIPSIATHNDPQLPKQTVPLYYGGDTYGFWQCWDVSAPNFRADFPGGMFYIPSNERGKVTYTFPQSGKSYEATFKINLNYVQPSRRHYYYVQTMVTADGAEGPPSEISDRIVVKPGTIPNIYTPRVSGYGRNRLYRSASSGEDSFFLIDDVDASSYSDNRPVPLNTALPPFGNYPDCAAAAFLAGSLIHPAQFGAAFFEKTLYLSDFYRLHVWPDEYTLPFQDDIDMIAMSGGTIVVFAGDNVFGVSGGDPEHMAKYLISDTARLLNPKGLCRIGQTLIYPSDDGLIGISGSTATNLTKEHFTRTDWADYDPATMEAKTADNSVFLEGDAGNLRVDLDETLQSVTTYTATSGVSLAWKSKRFRFDQKTVFDYAKIVAEGDVTLKVYADRVLVKTVTVENSRPVALSGLSHALEWEFAVTSDSVIREMTFYERTIQPVQDIASLTPANTPLWESSWFMFPDRGRFCAGMLRRQGNGAVTVKFYQDGTTLVDTESVSDGHIFALPRDLETATYWRVMVDTDAPVEELVLFAKQTEQIAETLQEVHSGNNIPPWLIKRYELASKRRIKSVIVDAIRPVTMRIYKDDATDAVASVTVADSTEVRLDDYGDFGVLEFDFDGSDHDIRSVAVFTQAIQPIATEPVTLPCIPSARGKLLKFADRGALAAYSVLAEDYSDITLRIYADGDATPVATETVTSGSLVPLSYSLAEAALWEVDVEADVPVDGIIVVPRSRVPVEGTTLHMTARDGSLCPWIGPRFEFSQPVGLRSVIVEADSYPITLRLRPENGDAVEYTISNRYEYGLDDLSAATALEFDFDGDDRSVNEVWLFGKEVIPVENSGLIMRSGGSMPSWRRKTVAFAEMGSFSVVRVMADDYTGMELRLSTGGIVRTTQSISDSSDTRLPVNLPNAREWEVDLIHHGQVRELHLIGRMRYPVQNGAVTIRREQEPFTWLDRRIIAPTALSFTSGRVIATDYPVTLTFYHEGVKKLEYPVYDDLPFRLPKTRPERLWELDVVPEDSGTMIEEVSIATSMGALSRG